MYLSKIIAALPLVNLVLSIPLNLSEPGPISGTTSHYNEVRGHTYHYLLAEPSVEPKGTVVLLHGFPDFSYTWRYQIPAFTALGYRVVAPDLLGYGGTDSPSDLVHFTHKEMASDLVNLLGQVAPNEQVILGGHDWGAGLVYETAIWYPDFAKALFTIAIPWLSDWIGPSLEWKDTATLIADGTIPTFGYQLQWRDQSIDRNFTTPSQVKLFYNTCFGGLTPDGRPGFTYEHGVDYDLMPLLGPNPLVSDEVLDFYVDQALRNGMRGPFNWYRTRRMDFEDELPLAEAGGYQFKTPTLFIPALQDSIILKRYYENMGDYFDSLEVQAVEAAHWAHWEKPEEVNKIVGDWIASLD